MCVILVAKDQTFLQTGIDCTDTQTDLTHADLYLINTHIFYSFHRFTLVVGSSAIWNETAESLKDLCKLNNVFVNKMVYFREPYAFSNDDMYQIVETTYMKTRSRLIYTTLTNFSTNYLVMCKVYTNVGGIN